MSENGTVTRRVVVTGIGMVTRARQRRRDELAARCSPGESGAGEITQFDHTDYPVHFACELKDFEPTDWVDHKSARRMDRFAQMILAAARQAEAGLRASTSPADPQRVGASIATGIGGLRVVPGLLRRPAAPRPRPGQPVLDPLRSSRTWAPAGSRSSSARRGR